MTLDTFVPQPERKSRYTSLRRAATTIISARSNSAAALQSFVTKVLILGVNAATSIVVARALRPAGRGEMSAMIMWPGFFAAILTFGLPSSLTFNLRRSPERSAETVGTASLLTLLIGLITGILGYLAVPAWLTNYSATDITYARWMLLASPLPMMLLVGRAALEAKGNFFASNLSLWSAPFLTLAGLSVLVFTGKATPLTSGLVYVLASVPPACLLAAQVWSTYHPHISKLRVVAYDLLHFGLRAWGVDLLNALAVSEHVLVVHFLSPSDMGTYVVAASLARMLSVFQTSAVTVLFPRIAAGDHEDVVQLTGLVFRITTLFAATGSLIAGALGPMLLRGVYGASYATGGSIVFRLLLAEVVLSGATQVLAQAFLALERPGSVTLIQAAGVGIGLLMMPEMIKHFGAAGAPAALLVSSVIRLMTTLLAFRPLLNTAAPRIWIDRRDLSFVAERVAGIRGAHSAVQS